MKRIAAILLLFICIGSKAQKTEQFVDFWMQPTKTYPYYIITKEKKNGRWYREVASVQTGALTLKGTYLDEGCKIRDGEEVTYYNEGGTMLYARHYKSGVKEGSWLTYHTNGRLKDSAVYHNGIRTGIALGWDSDGRLTDSTNLDANGNGTYASWFPGNEKKPWISGAFESDTLRAKHWIYYHENGQVRAKIDFNKGKVETCQCYDEAGKQLPADMCVEREAAFKGGEEAWLLYLQRKLNGNVPARARAPKGVYTVIVQFVVNAEGVVTDLKPQTNYGFGMEQEAVRVLKASPKWKPAVQFGRNVNAYRRQPISFSVED